MTSAAAVVASNQAKRRAGGWSGLPLLMKNSCLGQKSRKENVIKRSSFLERVLSFFPLEFPLWKGSKDTSDVLHKRKDSPITPLQLSFALEVPFLRWKEKNFLNLIWEKKFFLDSRHDQKMVVGLL